MIEFFTQQLDYIFFFYGLSFLFLSSVCFFMRDKVRYRFTWIWLCCFGLFHGIGEWLDLVALSINDTAVFSALRMAVMAVSFLFLIEFGRSNLFLRSNKRINARVYLPLIAVALCGWWFGFGIKGLNAFSRYALGFTGAAWSGIVLMRRAALEPQSNRLSLRVLGLSMLCYAFASGIIVPQIPIFPASLINQDSFFAFAGFPIQLLRGILALCMASSAWLYYQRIRTLRYRIIGNQLGMWLLLIFGLVLFAGWILTNTTGNKAKNELKEELLLRAKTAAAAIDPARIKNLSGSSSDIHSPDYQRIKEQIVRIKATDPTCRFVYVMGFRQGNVIFYVDSEPPTSKDYSAPGDIYYEASPELIALFSHGQPYVEGPSRDKWGKWVSGLVAIRDTTTKEVLGVLGIDINANQFEKIVASERIEPIAITLLFSLILVIFFVFYQVLQERSSILKENEKELLEAQRTAHLGHWSYDVSSGQFVWSVEMCHIFGRKPGRVAPTYYEYKNLIHAEDWPVFDDAMKAATEHGRAFDMDVRILLPDQSERSVVFKAKPEYDSQRHVSRLTGTAQDVTLLKRAEQLAAQQLRFIQTIIDTIPNPLYFKDKNFTYQLCNKKFEEYIGKPRQEIIGKTIFEVAPKDLAETYHAKDAELLQQCQAQVYEGVIYSNTHQMYRSVIFYKAVVRNPENEVIGLVCVVLDIEERKQMEAELRENEKKFHAVFDESYQFIGLMTLDGMLLQANRTALELSGVKKADVLGKPFWEGPWWSHSIELQQQLRELIKRAAAGEFVRAAVTHPGKDGALHYVDFSIKPVKDDTGKVVLLIPEGRDITDYKKVERELHEKQKQVIEANEDLQKNEAALKNILYDLTHAHEDLKNTQQQLLQTEKLSSIGQLAAGIAHEINNPVGFIGSNMQTMEEYVKSYTSILALVENLKHAIEQKNWEKAETIVSELKNLERTVNLDFIMTDSDKLLQESQRGVERIKKIVLDMRTFAREDKGEKEFAKVEDIINSVISIAHNEIKYKAELKKEFGETAMVKCFVQQLGQVFINLLVNAAQAIENHGEITVKTYQKEGCVYVDISDTGKGIPEENLTKIFNPFFTTKKVGQGTGLGLSISYDIVKKHGGDITLKSQVGKGTTFTVMLPIVQESPSRKAGVI